MSHNSLPPNQTWLEQPRAGRSQPRGTNPWAELLRRLDHGQALPARGILGQSIRQLCILPLRYWFLTSGLFSVLGLLVSPLISRLLLEAVHQAGLPALTDRNMGTLFSSPVSMLLGLVAFILITLATFLCFATLLIVAQLQLARVPPSLVTVGRRLMQSVRKPYRGGGMLVAVQLGILGPLVGLTLFAPVTGGLGIPPFIGREYMKTPLSALLWCSAAALIVYGIYKTILTLPLSLICKQGLGKSFRESLRATRRGGLWLPLSLAIAASGAMLLSRLGATVFGSLVDILDSIMSNTGAAVVSVSLAFGFLTVATSQGFAFLFMGTAKNYAAAPRLSRSTSARTSPSDSSPAHPQAVHSQAAHPQAVARHVADQKVRRRRSFREEAHTALTSLAVLVIACAVGAATLPAATATTSAASLAASATSSTAATATSTSQPLVMGHRGYDSGGVENTISGLEAAAAFNLDVVEADFQQTSDGEFVASHDTNLFLLAGVNENIYAMTTAQVTATVVTMKGHSDTIPTMSQYVTRARELNIPLLIELKVTGHEQGDFVQDFLSDLDDLGALSGNSFHSLDADAVESMKALRPDLRVGLTLGMVFGGLPNVPCDFYVIEQASVTPEIIKAAHQAGRAVYAWTVNGSSTMRQLFRDGIDGLVTDHPDTAESIRNEVTSAPGYILGDARNSLLLWSRTRKP